MFGLYILTDSGQVEPTENFQLWQNQLEKTRRVAFDDVNGVEVSTVFLGLDASGRMDDRNPRVFETMLFGDVSVEHQMRYETLEQAKRGHYLIVCKLQERLQQQQKGIT